MSLLPLNGSAGEFDLNDLRHLWGVLSSEDRVTGFRLLSRDDAEDFFLSLAAQEQAEVILGVPSGERRLWVRQLAPDDAADVIQAVPRETRDILLALCDERTRREVVALLAYQDDEAGGLMSPRFARVRSEATADEAVRYLRQQARRQLETIYYAYVVDPDQRLMGVVSFRELFAAPGDRLVRELMEKDFISVPEDMDQEDVARLMSLHDLMAIPVVDIEGCMKGIVTFDDLVDVVEEEATEDMQKLGGMEALDTPYLQTGLADMVRKRGAWLSVLLVGEMLTTTAMGYYQEEIARAVVLTLFVPLIISSGGNSGSQATTLVIRAMALGELRLVDWWRVIRRELASGLCLGCILAVIGGIRILLGDAFFHGYGGHVPLLALTVAISLVGVVTWGTVIGATLPFILRRFGFDPASASAPFVATLVDVFGLAIYFTAAEIILRGTLL
ncbi:MAG: magnesium transporter [Proteobacteria bacterium]|nr:magnesium transporter [Pseudomonadota bacterium]